MNKNLIILKNYMHFIPDKDILEYITHREIWLKSIHGDFLTQANALSDLQSTKAFGICDYLNVEDLYGLLEYRQEKALTHEIIDFGKFPEIRKRIKKISQQLYQKHYL